MKDALVTAKTQKEQAIELFATNPNIEVREVARLIGVIPGTISNWRRDPTFAQKIFDRFNVELEARLPNMLLALEREGLAGNVNAIKLMLEYTNKLQKNINITIASPFEVWKKHQSVEAEVVEGELPELDKFKDLPPRTANNSHLEVHKERVRIKNAAQVEKSIKNRNKARREQYKWLKRASVVNVSPLSAKRPTPGQKQAWKDKIIAAEKLASGSPQEQVGNNKTPCKPKNQKQEVPKTPTPPKT